MSSTTTPLNSKSMKQATVTIEKKSVVYIDTFIEEEDDLSDCSIKQWLQDVTSTCIECSNKESECFDVKYGDFLLKASKEFYKSHHKSDLDTTNVTNFCCSTFHTLFALEYYKKHEQVPDLFLYQTLPGCLKRNTLPKILKWVQNEKICKAKDDCDKEIQKEMLECEFEVSRY